MPATVVVGAQWGDEGKGKITDWLADQMDMVVRYQGGNNAGHTVVVGGEEFKLHLVPSGVLYPRTVPVIANGVVVDPLFLLEEMKALRKRGVNPDRLVISSEAHLIMPYHQALDGAMETQLGKSKIGTTRKGIGPAYADKVARIGLRMQDLQDMKAFRLKLEQVLKMKNILLTKVYGLSPFDTEEIMEQYGKCARELDKYISDTSRLINQALDQRKNVLLEGAQGTLLDVDHGTYPYVTSSSPVAGGACVGAGISPLRVKKVIGVLKAYITRVGSGPMPTEQKNEVGEALSRGGWEYGTTTGRKRRCGWLDGVLLRYAVQLNGFTSLAVTKLDVLSQFKTVKICVGYKYGSETYEHLPSRQSIFEECVPVYEELEGWQEEIGEATSYNELPPAARHYIARIEELAGIPVELISVGAKRTQTIVIKSSSKKR